MPAFKFKPYDAIKTAKKATAVANGAVKIANGAPAAIGIGLEVWSMLGEQKKAADFEKTRQSIAHDLSEQQSSILKKINAPDFLLTYFPQIDAMQKLFSALAAASAEASEHSRRTREWANLGEALHLRLTGEPRLFSGNGLVIDA